MTDCFVPKRLFSKVAWHLLLTIGARQLAVYLGIIVAWHLLLTIGARQLIASEPVGPWLAYGDIRGHVEPCGCDPSTDLGGLARIAVGISDLRLLEPQVSVISLGNELSHKQHDPHHEAMINFTKIIRPDAVLYNRNELANGEFVKTALDQAKLPFVLSFPELTTPTKVQRYIVTEKKIFFGFVSSPHASAASAAKQIELWRKKYSNLTAFLLFSGTDRDWEFFLKQDFIDIKLSSNTTPDGAEPLQKERDEPGLLVRSGGYMVPSFGQGILLSPELTKKHHNQPFTTPALPPSNSGLTELVQQSPFVWLNREYQRPSSVSDLLSQVAVEARKRFKTYANKRVKDLRSSPFAGAHKCAGCHAASFQTWKDSAHSTALETLINKQQDQNPECVGCHVLGFYQNGGYVDQQRSPQFKGVQCENCHGAALAHTKNPTMDKPTTLKPKNACATCHKGAHSPHFDYHEYWPLIAHPKTN